MSKSKIISWGGFLASSAMILIGGTLTLLDMEPNYFLIVCAGFIGLGISGMVMAMAYEENK